MNKVELNIIQRILEISTICKPERHVDIVEYAKSAIRDVFISMPTRSVYKYLMPSYLNQISSQLGEKETKLAWEYLKSTKWITYKHGKYFWKKVFGPVNIGASEREKINESPDFIGTKDMNITVFHNHDYITFGYVDDVLLISDLIHPETYELYTGNLKDRTSFKYPGRLFTDINMISFWTYPTTNTQLIDILKQIQISYPFYFIYRYMLYLDTMIPDCFGEKTTIFKPIFDFMKESYITGNIKLLLNQIKSLKSITIKEKSLLIKKIKNIYDRYYNFKIDINKYNIEMTAYYTDWDDVYTEHNHMKDFYKSIGYNNIDNIIVPVKNYKLK